MAKAGAKRRWGNSVPDRNEQFELKRQAVLRTAARTYSERGVSETTLSEIAQRLHISKPALYYYFRSKDEILFECHRLGIDAIANPAKPLPGPGEQTARERLVEFLHRYTRMVTDDFGTCLVMTGVSSLEPRNRRAAVAGRRQVDQMLREILADGARDGSLGACDPKMTAMFIFGALNWIPRWYKADGSLTVDQLAERVTAFVLNAVGGKG